MDPLERQGKLSEWIRQDMDSVEEFIRKDLNIFMKFDDIKINTWVKHERFSEFVYVFDKDNTYLNIYLLVPSSQWPNSYKSAMEPLKLLRQQFKVYLAYSECISYIAGNTYEI